MIDTSKHSSYRKGLELILFGRIEMLRFQLQTNNLLDITDRKLNWTRHINAVTTTEGHRQVILQ